MILAMARRRDLPVGLSCIQETSGVPIYGVLASGLIAAVIAAIGAIPLAAASASFAILIYYAIANLAALKQPDAERLYPRWVSQCGLAICILLSVSLEPVTIAIGVTILSIGLLGRWLALRMRAGSISGI